LGAKMVEFAGFLMPVSYGSIIEEHRAVRERVGIFDVSHMGEFLVTGPRAREFVNEVITNDCSKLAPGMVQYSVMCRENGTAVDDLLVFAVEENRLLLVVNASNIDKDFAHVLTFPKNGVIASARLEIFRVKVYHNVPVNGKQFRVNPDVSAGS